MQIVWLFCSFFSVCGNLFKLSRFGICDVVVFAFSNALFVLCRA